MIVFYKLPNMLTLPYKVIKKVELRDEKNVLIFDEDGNQRFVNKDSFELFKFIPGRNNISKELWLKIVEYNKEDMDHYNSILKIFRPVMDEKTQEEVGENEDKLNLKDLSLREMKDLIDNTMDIVSINRYLQLEKERDKPRSSIIKSIKVRKVKITKADEVLIKNSDE